MTARFPSPPYAIRFVEGNTKSSVAQEKEKQGTDPEDDVVTDASMESEDGGVVLGFISF
jgi:hypothetical protein